MKIKFSKNLNYFLAVAAVASVFYLPAYADSKGFFSKVQKVEEKEKGKYGESKENKDKGNLSQGYFFNKLGKEESKPILGVPSGTPVLSYPKGKPILGMPNYFRVDKDKTPSYFKDLNKKETPDYFKNLQNALREREFREREQREREYRNRHRYMYDYSFYNYYNHQDYFSRFPFQSSAEIYHHNHRPIIIFPSDGIRFYSFSHTYTIVGPYGETCYVYESPNQTIIRTTFSSHDRHLTSSYRLDICGRYLHSPINIRIPQERTLNEEESDKVIDRWLDKKEIYHVMNSRIDGIEVDARVFANPTDINVLYWSKEDQRYPELLVDIQRAAQYEGKLIYVLPESSREKLEKSLEEIF